MLHLVIFSVLAVRVALVTLVFYVNYYFCHIENLVFRKEDSADGLTNYTKEFQPSVWCLVFTSVIACSILLWIITRVNPSEAAVNGGDLSLFVVETFCNNCGTSIEFKSNSGRMLSFTLFLTTMLFYVHYTSFLVSCLTVTDDKVPFTNLYELYAKRNQYKLLLSNHLSAMINLQETNNEIGRKILSEMLHPESLGNISFGEEALHILKTENAVTILTKDKIIQLNWQNELLRSPLMYFTPIAWPIRKESVFTDVLNYHFVRCIEAGIYGRLEEKWKTKFNLNKVDDIKNIQPMTLKNVWFPFAVMGIGIAISVLILILEAVIKKHKNRIVSLHGMHINTAGIKIKLPYQGDTELI